MFAATTSPSYSPTWVSGQMPVTSPIAQSRSPARRYSSTWIPRGSASTPTVSRPIPATRGRRPVATSSRSPRSSAPPSSCRTYSSPSRRAAVACLPSITSTPSRRRASPSPSPSGAGSRGSTCPAPSTSTASPPSRRTTCAISTPTGPPPRISRRRGTAVIPVASRFVHTPSSADSPGIGGTIGSEPVATTMCSAVCRTPATSTAPVPSSRPVPRSRSIPRPASQRSCPASE